MVYVLLSGAWTDGDGVSHAAGDTVDVDPATLAELQSLGLTADPTKSGGDGTDWVGPTSDKP